MCSILLWPQLQTAYHLFRTSKIFLFYFIEKDMFIHHRTAMEFFRTDTNFMKFACGFYVKHTSYFIFTHDGFIETN